ncbi:Kinesin-like protein KIF22 [Exophiala dermatitidis]
MSVRVVARIRPLLKSEHEKDQIVTSHSGADGQPTIIKIPNPKNFAEEYSFQFNSVYEQTATQQEIFDAEVAPTVKHLFLGYDVTIFAYGSTGTGKTHTMRGGKSLADRGMIPRLLSSIYRKSRAIEKSSYGETTVAVSMSYYEIYNDRVFDLFEAPEKRTVTGLPIREAESGKTVVVGLTEMPCGSLKEFEMLYDKANANRSTGATKLNAHSSRSHAILCVKVTITSPTETRVSTASAIDLAGSEDNRRTGNGKDRMVESASINKSLFVLAQCVEAISKKQPRIPYRESKMTRILSLGQNNGFTVMILNLAPVKSYHLDILSSLNFANRTKKIEVREVENEPIFKGPPRQAATGGTTIQRQPLRPLSNGINVNLTVTRDAPSKNEKPPKAFSVYSDRTKTAPTTKPAPQKSSPLKRTAETSFLGSTRPSKISRPTPNFIRRGPEPTTLTKASIETLVEKKVSEILAARALNAPDPAPAKNVSEEVQRRLDSIEKRLEGQDGERAEGLSYLFMAKQHQARGEDGSALKMYELARPYFPDNEKLQSKIERLREKLARKRVESEDEYDAHEQIDDLGQRQQPLSRSHGKESYDAGHDRNEDGDDDSYHDYGEESDYHNSNSESDDGGDRARSHRGRPKKQKQTRKQNKTRKGRPSSPDPLADRDLDEARVQPGDMNNVTPRTQHLLDIINSRDVARIKTLSGLGAKRAESIVEYLNTAMAQTQADVEGGDHENVDGATEGVMLRNWDDLTRLRGIGKKTLEAMREGVGVLV